MDVKKQSNQHGNRRSSTFTLSLEIYKSSRLFLRGTRISLPVSLGSPLFYSRKVVDLKNHLSFGSVCVSGRIFLIRPPPSWGGVGLTQDQRRRAISSLAACQRPRKSETCLQWMAHFGIISPISSSPPIPHSCLFGTHPPGGITSRTLGERHMPQETTCGIGFLTVYYRPSLVPSIECNP